MLLVVWYKTLEIKRKGKESIPQAPVPMTLRKIPIRKDLNIPSLEDTTLNQGLNRLVRDNTSQDSNRSKKSSLHLPFASNTKKRRKNANQDPVPITRPVGPVS